MPGVPHLNRVRKLAWGYQRFGPRWHWNPKELRPKFAKPRHYEIEGLKTDKDNNFRDTKYAQKVGRDFRQFVRWRMSMGDTEVEGTVEFVVEPSTYLSGRWVEKGEVRVQGDVIARLDPSTYRIARDQAVAALDVAREELKTAQVQLEEALPADVRRAQAQLERADAEYVRIQEAVAKDLRAGTLVHGKVSRSARGANTQICTLARFSLIVAEAYYRAISG